MDKTISARTRFHQNSQTAAGWLTRCIDLFFPLFRNFMPLQTFRYAVCGASNQFLNLCIYHLSYIYLFQQRNWELGGLTFKPHIAAAIIAIGITVPIGFLLARYVIFTDSEVRFRHQLGRYLSIALICLPLNYFLLKLFVEIFHWDATLSMAVTILIVAVFSFVSQKLFAFKSTAS